MKRFILLATATIAMLAVCADRPRKNPLDPKNTNSKRDRAALVELFTSDAPVYYDTAYTGFVASRCDTAYDSSAAFDSAAPGTVATIAVTVRETSAVAKTERETTNTYVDSAVYNFIWTYYCTLAHDTSEDIDTIPWFDSLGILISDSYETDGAVIAEYHVADEYAIAAAGSLWNTYQSAAGAGGAADTVAAAYFNGTDVPVDLSDTTRTNALRYSDYESALSAHSGQTSYYTLEGDLTTTAPDSITMTYTGSGRLARLGSEDGDSITVRYIFTRYVSADHPYVVVGTVAEAYRLSAPEAGRTYELPDHTITIAGSFSLVNAHIIVAVQDAATGEVLQAVLDD